MNKIKGSGRAMAMVAMRMAACGGAAPATVLPRVAPVEPAPTAVATPDREPVAPSTNPSAPTAPGATATTITLPGGATVSGASDGLEARVFAALDDHAAPPPADWIDLDRVAFASGAGTLEPEADPQLGNLAALSWRGRRRRSRWLSLATRARRIPSALPRAHLGLLRQEPPRPPDDQDQVTRFRSRCRRRPRR